MRILHLSTRLILGGSQENTVLSCEGQADLGHDVHLAYGPVFGPEGSMVERVQAHGGIETHVVPNLVRELHPRRDPLALRECRRLIRRLKPDVIHTHSSKAGVLGRSAGWSEGGAAGERAVIHTIHGLPFHPWEKAWRNRVYVAMERWAAPRCHRIVSVCDAMTRQSLAQGIGRPEMYTTVYSGMEVDRFIQPAQPRHEMRRRLGILPHEFVVGTVARLAELKGHDDILDALAELMLRDQRIRLLWVGDGYFRDRLQRRVVELGLLGRVVFTGLVTPDEVGAHMTAMDVLVHPSYREGLPRTVPQALLTGVPVVTYALDGGPEVCRHGDTGLLVRPGDLRGLRDAVLWMEEHPRERAEMAERGRAWCRERFTAKAMVDGLDRVYRETLEFARRHPGQTWRPEGKFSATATGGAAGDRDAAGRFARPSAGDPKATGGVGALDEGGRPLPTSPQTTSARGGSPAGV